MMTSALRLVACIAIVLHCNNCLKDRMLDDCLGLLLLTEAPGKMPRP